MKKLLLAIICFAAYAENMKAQTLQTTRKTVFLKYTADWCPPCGGWGWALFDSMLHRQETDTSFKAICMAYHFTSDQEFLNTQMSSDINANTPIGFLAGLPGFLVSNTDITSALAQASVSARPSVALQNIHAQTTIPSVAGIGFDATVKNNDSLIVQTRIKFLNAVTGEYRVAVYVIEDSISGYQTDESNNLFTTHHRMILKNAILHGTFGSLLTNNGAAVGQEFINQFRMKIPIEWNKNRLKYIAILYRMDANGKYIVENATDKGNVTITGLSSINGNIQNFNVYPVPAKDKIIISISLKNKSNATVSLYDLQGRKITELFNGNIPARQQKELICKLPNDIARGTYILQCITESGCETRTIVLEN